MPKTEHMITPDGDLHVYNARIAEYNGWLKATPAEVKAHFEAHLVVVEDENPELPEEAQESGDEELTTANARIKELEEKLARKDIGTASALPVQSKPASNDENDSQETGGEEEKNDPDTCETLGEAVATVNSMTSKIGRAHV